MVSTKTKIDWSRARRMQSRREGICAECNGPIKINTAIFWNGDVFKAAHAACADPMMANPWFVQHLAGEYAFHPQGQMGRAIAEQLVRGEYVGQVQNLPCGNCPKTTWFKATIGTYVCPDCGAVGHPDITEKIEEQRVEQEQEIRAFESDPDYRAYLAEQRREATDTMAWAKACQRHADDPFEEGCDGPCCSGARIESAGVLSREDRIRLAAEEGDSRNRRQPLRNFQQVAENYGVVVKLKRESAPPVVGGEQAPIVAIPDGRYTVVFADGGYRTLRLRKNQNADFFGGEGQKLYYLSGPDNDADYTSFGLLKTDGTVVIWKKFQPEKAAEFRQAMAVLLGDPSAAREAYALRSGRCARCNRTLTVPSSLHRGLGPECANKI